MINWHKLIWKWSGNKKHILYYVFKKDGGVGKKRVKTAYGLELKRDWENALFFIYSEMGKPLLTY